MHKAVSRTLALYLPLLRPLLCHDSKSTPSVPVRPFSPTARQRQRRPPASRRNTEKRHASLLLVRYPDADGDCFTPLGGVRRSPSALISSAACARRADENVLALSLPSASTFIHCDARRRSRDGGMRRGSGVGTHYHLYAHPAPSINECLP
jgi:hypothetical protein